MQITLIKIIQRYMSKKTVEEENQEEAKGKQRINGMLI